MGGSRAGLGDETPVAGLRPDVVWLLEEGCLDTEVRGSGPWVGGADLPFFVCFFGSRLW